MDTSIFMSQTALSISCDSQVWLERKIYIYVISLIFLNLYKILGQGVRIFFKSTRIYGERVHHRSSLTCSLLWASAESFPAFTGVAGSWVITHAGDLCPDRSRPRQLYLLIVYSTLISHLEGALRNLRLLLPLQNGKFSVDLGMFFRNSLSVALMYVYCMQAFLKWLSVLLGSTHRNAVSF